MLRRLFTIPILLLITTCYQDFAPVSPIDTSPVRTLSQHEKGIVAGNNSFGFTLFQETIQTKKDDNIFISPLSVALALAMAYNGAANETEVAMRSTLGFAGLTRDDLNQAFLSLSDLLMQLDAKVLFEVANSIWYRQGLQIESDFVDRNAYFYHAEVQPLDFTDPLSVNIINQWVDSKTHGRIPTILDAINPLSMMYLTNAIYFKGTWTFQFDQSSTYNDAFYSEPNNSIECKMMVQSNNFAYFENDAIQAIDLPYGDGHFNTAIVLPRSNDLSPLLDALDEPFWNNLCQQFVVSEGTIMLPKFKTSYELSMTDILRAIGMEIAFDSNRADFSDACKTMPLYITDVIHKTFLQMDEEGTEAAAVTSVTLGTTSAHGPEAFVMYVNHPFLVIIHERHTQSILFIGIINKPNWS